MTLKEGHNNIKDSKTGDITRIFVQGGNIMSISFPEKKFKMKREVIEINDDEEELDNISTLSENVSLGEANVSDIVPLPSQTNDNSFQYERNDESFSDEEIDFMVDENFVKKVDKTIPKQFYLKNDEEFSEEEEDEKRRQKI